MRASPDDENWFVFDGTGSLATRSSSYPAQLSPGNRLSS
jgi:hypothetical protein